MSDLKNKPEEYWKEKLTLEQYRVVREKGTEAPFSGKYLNNHETGMYECVACGQQLFSSDAKIDSGTGWPSFDEPVNKEHIELQHDYSHFMHRIEVLCKNCDAHLGHVFSNGPKETSGMLYCLNSCALNFKPKE